MMFACGWRYSCTSHGRLAVHESGIANVLLAIDHGRHVGQSDRRSVMIGNDQRRIILGKEKLVVAVRAGPMRFSSASAPLGTSALAAFSAVRT